MPDNNTYTITDNMSALLSVLPQPLQNAVTPEMHDRLLELILDLGRRPEARFEDHFEYLSKENITRADLDFVESHVGTFGDDNRAGIPATLHRISAMRNRRGDVVGLTLRVGRAVTGIVDILRDLIEDGQSLLLMGKPGLGKTTLLREMARILADDFNKRVVIVDTSNEIAGDGDVPHPAIGRARRMQVPHVNLQHHVMIEAVENHMPEVVVIDEIGHEEETLAARTIAERGVQLIATAHGNTLENLLANPTLNDLAGGITTVTLSDLEARRRRTQKTVQERKSPPSFDVMVEMISRNQIAVRRPLAEVVDALLRGFDAPAEIRTRDEDGNIQIEKQIAPSFDDTPLDKSTFKDGRRRDMTIESAPPQEQLNPSQIQRIYGSGINRSRLVRAIKQLGLNLQVASSWQRANAILMLAPNGKAVSGSQWRKARRAGLPIITTESGTYAGIETALSNAFNMADSLPPDKDALREARNAAHRVLSSGQPAELRPQNRAIRKMQHQLAARSRLRSFSVGKEPHRRVRFLPASSGT